MLTMIDCCKNQSVKLVRSKDNIWYNVGDLKRFSNAVTFPAINYKASFLFWFLSENVPIKINECSLKFVRNETGHHMVIVNGYGIQLFVNK